MHASNKPLIDVVLVFIPGLLCVCVCADVVASSAVASSLVAQLLLLGPQAVPWAAFVALHITHRECREAALQQLLQVGALWAVGCAYPCLILLAAGYGLYQL
jgi:hypothetical protein